MKINVKLPASLLEVEENTLFPTADSLEEAVEIAVKALPESHRNTVLKCMWIYHNTLVADIKKAVGDLNE